MLILLARLLDREFDDRRIVMRLHLVQLPILLMVTALVGISGMAQVKTREIDKYALIVGISGYPNYSSGDEQLVWADSDAREFFNFIQKPEGGSFSKKI